MQYSGIVHYQLLKIIILNLNSSVLLAQLGNIFQYSLSTRDPYVQKAVSLRIVLGNLDLAVNYTWLTYQNPLPPCGQTVENLTRPNEERRIDLINSIHRIHQIYQISHKVS